MTYKTAAGIKKAYEGMADTNAYTDAEKSKLYGILSNMYTVVPNDNVLYTSPTACSNCIIHQAWTKFGASLTVIPSTMAYGQTYRLKYGMHTYGGYTIYGRIYVNNISVGTERSNNTDVWVYYTEDLTLNPGDVVVLWGNLNTDSGGNYMSSLSIEGTKTSHNSIF